MWLKQLFFSSPDITILDQRYKLMLTKLEKIKFDKGLSKETNEIVAKLEFLFENTLDWTSLSQIEIYMVSLYSDSEIELELKVKLMESKEKLSSEMTSFYETEAQSSSDKKSTLNSLYEKLHISDDIENLEKSYVAKTRIRTSIFFFVAILLFFAVDQIPAITSLLSITKGDKGDAILTAMTSGCMGACFSMLIGLRSKLSSSSLQDLKIIHRIDYLFSRTIIGVTSGLIMYYFFQSELFNGPIFPHFNAQATTKTIPIIPLLTDKEFSLLVIWCFLSGFSEKLVPDLLAQTEEKVK